MEEAFMIKQLMTWLSNMMKWEMYQQDNMTTILQGLYFIMRILKAIAD